MTGLINLAKSSLADIELEFGRLLGTDSPNRRLVQQTVFAMPPERVLAQALYSLFFRAKFSVACRCLILLVFQSKSS